MAGQGCQCLTVGHRWTKIHFYQIQSEDGAKHFFLNLLYTFNVAALPSLILCCPFRFLTGKKLLYIFI